MSKAVFRDKEYGTAKHYLLYTIVFLLMAGCVYFPFIYYGKSFVFCDENGGGDGLVQHYNSFVYYGRYLRAIIRTLWTEHRLVIPMWDMSIGYGQDIITTLSYYVIGDPFAFLSVFFPTAYAEAGYCAMILLRMYCAGAAFLAYCRYRGLKGSAVLVGSMMYTFCYYGLSAPILHPYFALPMIYLPLLLIGAEKMLTEKKVLFYIAAVGLAAISNFYFFYMLVLMIVLYVLFRYLEIFGRIRLQELAYWVFRFLICSIHGVLLASVLLLPSVISMLGVSRTSIENYVPLFYSADYYKQILTAFVNGGFGYVYTFYGYTGLGLLAVFDLFLICRKNRQYIFLAVGFLMLLAFSMLPFMGHLFNGMGYVTNRWIWALAMLAAYITTLMIPEFRELNKRQWSVLAILTAGYCILVYSQKELQSEVTLITLVSVIVTAAVVWVLASWKKQLLSISCLGMVIIMLIGNAYFLYLPLYDNFLRNYAEQGNAYQMLVKEAPEYPLKGYDDSLYRFDLAKISSGDARRNSAMLLNLKGIPYYFSSTNSSTTAFITDLHLNYAMDQSFNSLDQRCFLESLMGVKYVIIPNKLQGLRPYGCDNLVLKGEKYSIYENENVFPIGYASDTVMAAEAYEKLSAVEKLQALMQTIVTEEETGLKEAEVDTLDINAAYSIAETDGISLTENGIEALKEGATMLLTFDAVKDMELYLELSGVLYEGTAESPKIKLQSGDFSTTIVYYTWKNNYYCGHENFIGTLGYTEQERNQILVTFTEKGFYHFDDMSVIAQPVEELLQSSKKLVQNTMENVEETASGLSGTIEVEADSMLCVQIPYSKGWTAYVDGEQMEPICVNRSMIGLKIGRGAHKIDFCYSTPYLKAGGILSLSAAAFYIVLCFAEFTKKRKLMK